ncbi:MAG: NusG domain II-containing protein [Endomicrobiales bacterium]
MKYGLSFGDKWLIAVIVIISMVVPLSISFVGTSAHTAQVFEQGTLIKVIDLSKDSESTLKLHHGFIVVQVKQGKIRARKCSCPEKVCIGMGWISKSGQSIVCVPNKLLIEVRGSENADYDAVTY